MKRKLALLEHLKRSAALGEEVDLSAGRDEGAQAPPARRRPAAGVAAPEKRAREAQRSSDGDDHDDDERAKDQYVPSKADYDALVEDDDDDDDDDGEDDGADARKLPADAQPVNLLSTRDRAILAARADAEEEVRNAVRYRNKQRVLVLSSRGVPTRYRHLMEDLMALLPHHRKEVKHDTKRQLYQINEVCEARQATGCVYLEARKRQDLYMWLTRAPAGPSLKFLVNNVHTMDELRMTGNALHGSRPVLSFDAAFEDDERAPHLALAREMLSATFGTPRGHPKSKPFVDRVMHFSLLDGRIWVRNYQIVDETTDARELKKAASLGKQTVSLVEIGPRLVLTLIKAFDGSFAGRVLYDNPEYVSPNQARSAAKKRAGSKYAQRKLDERESGQRFSDALAHVPHDPLGDVF